MSYTFAEHAQRAYAAAQAGQPLRQWVQLKIGKETACGHLVDLWTTPDGLDLWRVQLQAPFKGLFYVTERRVRQCSGVDGRCSCAREGDLSAPEGAQAERATQGAERRPGGLTC